jgi:hypothetical protein
VGTAVTVTRFFEVDDVKPTNGQIVKVSPGLRAATLGHKARNRVITGKAPTLQVPATVMSKGFGLLFKNMLGAATIAQIAASPTWRQIHLPADTTGLSMTVQAGVAESYTGTVRPYTYNGCKVSDWELSCQMDDLLKLSVTLDAWNWSTATALATSSYPTALEAFHFAELSVTIGATASTSAGRTTVTGGTALKGCRGVSLKGTNGMRTDRRVAGSGGVKIEQIRNDFLVVTGDLDLEFADRTQVLDLADSGTPTTLVFTWTGTTSDGSGNFPILRIIHPQAVFEPSQPSTNGPDVVDGKVTFTAYEDNANVNPMIQLEYESQDVAV